MSRMVRSTVRSTSASIIKKQVNFLERMLIDSAVLITMGIGAKEIGTALFYMAKDAAHAAGNGIMGGVAQYAIPIIYAAGIITLTYRTVRNTDDWLQARIFNS